MPTASSASLILARPAFVRSREIAIAAHDPPNAYIWLQQELLWLVLPYQADNLAERERLMAEGDALLDQSKGSMSGLGLHSALMELLLLNGRWGEARDLVADPGRWSVFGFRRPVALDP